MGIVIDHPIEVFILAFVVLSIAARLGTAASKRRRFDNSTHEDFSVIQAATLTLLGLIIGFTFSMAISRYDVRKAYEEEEANAIGTEYARASLLPAADAEKVRGLLAQYLDQRIRLYRTHDAQGLRALEAETSRQQDALWVAVLAPAAAQPTPVVALAVSGMNDVLNAQGYMQAAWRNRIPVAAWVLLFMVGVCGTFMVGYGTRSARMRGVLQLLLPLVLALSFMLIADIDSPRGGFVHVDPINLRTLATSIQG
jgi:hypothetical protein